MKNPVNLTVAFNKFIGREVCAPTIGVTSADPVLKEILELANKKGLKKVRPLYPRSRCTKDFRIDRLNVRIGQDDNQKYFITRFSIG